MTDYLQALTYLVALTAIQLARRALEIAAKRDSLPPDGEGKARRKVTRKGRRSRA